MSKKKQKNEVKEFSDSHVYYKLTYTSKNGTFCSELIPKSSDCLKRYHSLRERGLDVKRHKITEELNRKITIYPY